MTQILPQSGRDSALALTDFPPVPGVITAEQREHLSTAGPWVSGWFVWNPEKGNPDGSAKGKVPIIPKTGKPGKVNDPNTAGTFDEAVAAVPAGGGVGVLVTNAKPGIVFLDFDHVVTDGVLSDVGREVVEQFKGAYVELSPSGTGLRVLALGTVNTERQRGGGVELYPAGVKRWLRMTGAVVRGTVRAVAPCQPGIDWAVSVLLSESPDNAGGQGAGSNVVPMRSSVNSLTVDQVLDRLEGYRGDWSKSAEEVEAALKLTAKRLPSGKIAEALSLMANGIEKSEHDMLVMCEAFRRGVGTTEEAAELLTGLATRKKVTDRRDYPTRTVEQAAIKVLQEIETPGFNRLNFRGWEQLPGGATDSQKDRLPAPLPEGMADALTVSGEQVIYARGRVAATPGNVKSLLVSDTLTRGLLAFNESTQDVEKTGSFRVFDQHATDKPGNLQDVDISFIQAWVHRVYGVNLKKGEVMQAVEMASRANSYDPLGDSLLNLGKHWDGVRRLRTWLRDHVMIDDTGCCEYVAEVGVCFMVGAVSRALNPGCKFDTVLTIEGPTGGGKSTLFQVLADAVGPDLFTDGVCDVTNAVHRVEATEGKFIVEMAELAGFRKTADQEALKTVLSQVRDKVRRAYAMRPVQIQRRYVFTATTNLSQYLADPTGALARRFWSVRSTATEDHPIDMDAFCKVAPQLWGEAVHLFREGKQKIFIEPGSVAWREWRIERDQRQEDLPFEEEVNQLMINIAGGIMGPTGADIKPVIGYRGSEGKKAGITAHDAALAMGLDPDKVREGKYSSAVAKTLRAKGFERLDKTNGVYRWHMPPDLLQASASMRKERAKETEI